MSYLLHGQNPVGIDERIAQLRAQLDPSKLGTTVIDIQSSTLPEIAAACQAMPFFGGSRVVVLLHPISTKRSAGATTRDAEDGATADTPDGNEDSAKVKWADLHALLKTVPDSTELIVRHDGSLAATHYLTKAAKAMDWKLEAFPALRSRDLLQWTSQRVTERGGSIDQHATLALLNRLFPQSWNVESRYPTGTPDIQLLATEIDKLVTAAGGATISAALVEDLVADREGYTAFKLNELTFNGNAGGALVELSDVLDAGVHPEMVISQSVGEAVGFQAGRIVAEFGPKEVARVTGFTEGRVGMLQRRAGSVPPAAQQRIAESIRSAGAAMRSTESNAPAVITPLVAEIAEAVRLSTLDRKRR